MRARTAPQFESLTMVPCEEKEPAMVVRHAACACGSLKVRCKGDPTKVSLCHCLDCQKRTGSTYGVAAFFRREDIESEGATRCYTRKSDSGHPVTFHFCPECGSTVYWDSAPDARDCCGRRRFIRRSDVPGSDTVGLREPPSSLDRLSRFRHSGEGPPWVKAGSILPGVLAALACTGEGRCCRDPDRGPRRSERMAGYRRQAPA